MNKVSGSDGIPVELLKILKDNAANKALHSKLEKLSSSQRTGKGRLLFQSQRRYYCTIALLSHASKVMLKSLQDRL